MRRRGSGLVHLAVAAGLAFGVFCAAPALAQNLGQVVSEILMIDRDRLLTETAFARRLQGEIEAESDALAREARTIEAELAAEEKALTEKRAELSPEDFRPLAKAFDEKVLAVRAASNDKLQALQARIEDEQLRLLNRIGPVLEMLMRDRGAVVILDRRVVFLSIEGIDVTDDAIARIDAALGDGTSTPGQE